MWLIDTETLRLHDRAEVETHQPHIEYAILSHRWEEDEVSFKQVRESFRLSLNKFKGWKKIQKFCALASSKGYKWAWVDTCCIDKSSSAELSEAINSMFDWYCHAGFCCIYLSDVFSETDLEAFRSSQWFARGWTLQELVASFSPNSVKFYSNQWQLIGSRRELAVHISRACGIPPAVLRNPAVFSYHGYTVAQRMSWASNRQTTRPEDVAYCLLGLFEVNMPLLYGEGRLRAFKRLQLEIIKNSNDESIFAWERSMEVLNFHLRTNHLLAYSPQEFALAGNITRGSPWPGSGPRAYTMTNRGLQIWAALVHGEKGAGSVTLPLDCSRGGETLGLVLYKSSNDAKEVYVRDSVTIVPDLVSATVLPTKEIIIQEKADLASAMSERAVEVNQKSSIEILEEELWSTLATFAPTSRDYSSVELSIFSFWQIRKTSIGLEFDFVEDSPRKITSVYYAEFCRRLKESILEPDWITAFLARLDDETSKS